VKYLRYGPKSGSDFKRELDESSQRSFVNRAPKCETDGGGPLDPWTGSESHHWCWQIILDPQTRTDLILHAVQFSKTIALFGAAG
jgi:hypothetical protein